MQCLGKDLGMGCLEEVIDDAGLKKKEKNLQSYCFGPTQNTQNPTPLGQQDTENIAISGMSLKSSFSCLLLEIGKLICSLHKLDFR